MKSLILHPHEAEALSRSALSMIFRPVKPQPQWQPFEGGYWSWFYESDGHVSGYTTEELSREITGNVISPLGAPGDRVCGKETWTPVFDGPLGVCPGIAYKSDKAIKWVDELPDNWIVYNAEKPEIWWWRSPITMPQWASRYTLEITSVGVVRMKEISEEDAKAWGCEAPITICSLEDPKQNEPYGYIYALSKAWDSHYAKRGLGFDTNPWAWAYGVKEVKA